MIVREFIKLFVYHIFLNSVLFAYGRNINLVENKYSALSDIVTHVVKSCNDHFQRVVINGDADESLIKSIRDSGTIAVILHDNSSATDLNLQYKNKIDLFVVTFNDSVDELFEILLTFEKSLWWNVMSPYFIFSGSKNGCKDAQVALKKIWKMNILTCYFVCLNSKPNPFIYTFNPYSKYAPDQWKFVEELRNGSDYMAIYNRPYIEENIHEGFNFDRTKYLDNATMNIAFCITPEKADLLPTITENNQYLIHTHFESRILEALKAAFKVTLKFNYMLQPSVSTSEPHGGYICLHNKTCDFATCPKTHALTFGFPGSHQIIYSGFSIFSSNQGYRTPLEKIYNFYGPLMIAATIIISTITYLVIWYVNRPRDFSFAAFEILRLWTCTSLYTKIDTLALRIFFFVIFLYFLILQATFQGNLSKFLTRPELRDNAESLADLESSSYEKIYATRTSIKFMADEKILEAKSNQTLLEKCITNVIDEKSSVCVSDYVAFLMRFERMKLSRNLLRNYHLSENLLSNNYFIYLTRHDWPLKEKFDHFLTVLEDTGNLLKFNKNLTSSLESVIFSHHIHPEVRPIDLKSLLFIFQFLIIGLTSATFCFILEKYNFARNKSKIASHINRKKFMYIKMNRKFINKNNRLREMKNKRK